MSEFRLKKNALNKNDSHLTRKIFFFAQANIGTFFDNGIVGTIFDNGTFLTMA